MAAKFSASSGNISVVMEWTKPQAVITRVVGNAAAYLFDKGQGNHGTEEAPRLFEDLSNQEMLDLVYNHCGQVVVDLANTWEATEAQRVAREATVPHNL